MVSEQERRNETLIQIVNGLSHHPALSGKLDPGLNGTQLRDQFIGIVADTYSQNLAEVANGSAKDIAIHNAYHILVELFPRYFAGNNSLKKQIKNK